MESADECFVCPRWARRSSQFIEHRRTENPTKISRQPGKSSRTVKSQRLSRATRMTDPPPRDCGTRLFEQSLARERRHCLLLPRASKAKFPEWPIPFPAHRCCFASWGHRDGGGKTGSSSSHMTGQPLRRTSCSTAHGFCVMERVLCAGVKRGGASGDVQFTF